MLYLIEVIACSYRDQGIWRSNPLKFKLTTVAWSGRPGSKFWLLTTLSLSECCWKARKLRLECGHALDPEDCWIFTIHCCGGSHSPIKAHDCVSAYAAVLQPSLRFAKVVQIRHRALRWPWIAALVSLFKSGGKTTELQVGILLTLWYCHVASWCARGGLSLRQI